MKKKITTIISILLIFSLIGSYGCASKNKYVKDMRGKNHKNEQGENVSEPSDNKDSNNNSSKNSTPIDPFEDLIVEFDGISPYCTISFNNSQCSEEVQKYVDYSIEKYDVTTIGRQFKIDEEVTVYAFLKNGQYPEVSEFCLTSDTKEYKVENVPEYITEITDDMDLSQLKTEINDYLDSITAFTAGNTAMGVNKYHSHTSPLLENIYFSALKLNSYNKFNGEYDCFNKINLLYSTTITSKGNFFGSDDGDYNRYFTICAKNIVQYPNGKIAWGKNDPNTLSFENNVNSENMESLVNSNITAIKTDYNVTDITSILK